MCLFFVMLLYGEGCIVMILLVMGLIFISGCGVYVVSKYVFEVWFDVLCMELWYIGIKVSLIELGLICICFIDNVNQMQCDKLVENFGIVVCFICDFDVVVVKVCYVFVSDKFRLCYFVMLVIWVVMVLKCILLGWMLDKIL